MRAVTTREITPEGIPREVRVGVVEENALAGRIADVPGDSQDGNAQVLTGAGLLLSTLVVLCLGVVLVWFAILRENRVFWTNAGGYPIWLRDLVLCTFLPLFGGVGLSLAALSMVCFSRLCRSLRFFAVEALLLLACWGLLSASGFIAFSNNFINIIEGRDVHYHLY